jgi:hypothetical protein
MGYARIPDVWKSGIPAISGRKFQYTDFTFESIVTSTEKRTLAMVQKTGGRVEGDKVFIRTQAPKAPKLEVWDDYGSPAERVSVGDKRWNFKGKWQQTARDFGSRGKYVSTVSSEKGAEASISFEGTGAIVTGAYLLSGGKLEVYLDGKLDRTLDVFADERNNRAGEAVWHGFGLKPGPHTLRLVVLGETYPGSKGADVSLEDLVVFR